MYIITYSSDTSMSGTNAYCKIVQTRQEAKQEVLQEFESGVLRENPESESIKHIYELLQKRSNNYDCDKEIEGEYHTVEIEENSCNIGIGLCNFEDQWIYKVEEIVFGKEYEVF